MILNASRNTSLRIRLLSSVIVGFRLSLFRLVAKPVAFSYLTVWAPCSLRCFPATERIISSYGQGAVPRVIVLLRKWREPSIGSHVDG